MYKRYVEKTGHTPTNSLLTVFKSNPTFTAGTCILLIFTIGALYGFVVAEDKYAGSSEFRQEYQNPPTLRSYILVEKVTERIQLDLGNLSTPPRGTLNKPIEKPQPKPVSYQRQDDEFIVRDKTGQPKVFHAHFFGTDSQGRDIFVRTIVSIRVYLLPSLIAISLSVFLGVLFGILGADIWTSQVAKLLRFFVQCLIDVLEALPKYVTILLAIILIPRGLRDFQWYGINWYGFYWLSFILGVLSAPKLGKLIMERIDVLKKREFIEAANAMGLSRFKVALKHVIRYNCLSFFFTQAAVLVTDVILIEVVLSYMSAISKQWPYGITVAEPNPSWGNILVEGRRYLFGENWWVSFFPLLIVLLSISAVYMFAHGLNQIIAQQRTSTELW